MLFYYKNSKNLAFYLLIYFFELKLCVIIFLIKRDYFLMDANVFISKVERNQINRGSKSDYHQMSIGYCDKDGEEGYFLTSVMTEQAMDSYERNLLGALNSTNWIEAIYGATLVDLTTILDSDNNQHLIGFESPFGLILKNEVKLYDHTPEMPFEFN